MKVRIEEIIELPCPLELDFVISAGNVDNVALAKHILEQAIAHTITIPTVRIETLCNEFAKIF